MNSQNSPKNNKTFKNLSELSALSGRNWSWVKLGDVCYTNKWWYTKS